MKILSTLAAMFGISRAEERKTVTLAFAEKLRREPVKPRNVTAKGNGRSALRRRKTRIAMAKASRVRNRAA